MFYKLLIIFSLFFTTFNRLNKDNFRNQNLDSISHLNIEKAIEPIDSIKGYYDNDNVFDYLFRYKEIYKNNDNKSNKNYDSIVFFEKYKLSKLGSFLYNGGDMPEDEFIFYDFDNDQNKEILSYHNYGDEINYSIRKFNKNKKVDIYLYVLPIGLYKNKYFQIGNNFKNLGTPLTKNKKLFCSINHQIEYDYDFMKIKNQSKLPVLIFNIKKSSIIDINNRVQVKNLNYLKFDEILKKCLRNKKK